MSQDPTITICIIGTISAGKSTLLNTFFSDYVSPNKLKKTTMCPQIYCETTDEKQVESFETIFNKNNDVNQKLYGTIREQKDIVPVHHIVGPITNIFGRRSNPEGSIVKLEYLVKIIDFPGLNDSETKDIYYKYLANESLNIDIVIMVIDIMSGLNTSDEIETLKFIRDEIITNNSIRGVETKTLILVNKCDYMDSNKKDMLCNEEHNELFQQIKNYVAKEKIECEIIPISCKNILSNQILLHDPKKLSTQDIDYIGSNKFGNIYWKKLQDEQKKDRLIDYVKDNIDDVYSSIDSSGKNLFVNALLNLIEQNKNNITVNSKIRSIMSETMIFKELIIRNLSNIRNNNIDDILTNELIKFNLTLTNNIASYDHPQWYEPIIRQQITKFFTAMLKHVYENFGEDLHEFYEKERIINYHIIVSLFKKKIGYFCDHKFINELFLNDISNHLPRGIIYIMGNCKTKEEMLASYKTLCRFSDLNRTKLTLSIIEKPITILFNNNILRWDVDITEIINITLDMFHIKKKSLVALAIILKVLNIVYFEIIKLFKIKNSNIIEVPELPYIILSTERVHLIDKIWNDEMNYLICNKLKKYYNGTPESEQVNDIIHMVRKLQYLTKGMITLKNTCVGNYDLWGEIAGSDILYILDDDNISQSYERYKDDKNVPWLIELELPQIIKSIIDEQKHNHNAK